MLDSQVDPADFHRSVFVGSNPLENGLAVVMACRHSALISASTEDVDPFQCKHFLPDPIAALGLAQQHGLDEGSSDDYLRNLRADESEEEAAS